MADNGNRGPNDFRSRNVRRRREPPIIDAAATEVPVDREVPLDPVADGEPPITATDTTGTETPAAAAQPESGSIDRMSEVSEPVLFGGALRESVPKAEAKDAVAPAEPALGEPDAALVDEPAEPPPAAATEAGGRDPAIEEPAVAPPPPFGIGAPPPAYTPPASAVPPAARSGGILPWLLGLAAVVLLGTLTWVLYTEPQRSGRDEMAATIADLQGKMAALEARPDPAQIQDGLAALDTRVAAAEADRTALDKSVSDLTSRLDVVAQDAQGAKAEADKAASVLPPAEAPKPDVQATVPAAPAPVAAVPAMASLAAVTALSAKVDGISAKVDGIDGRLAALADDDARTAKTVADLPKPVAPDFGPVDAKVAALDTRLNGLDGKVNASDSRFNGFDAKVNAVDGKINGFDARMNGLDARVNGLETKADDTALQAGKLQGTVANLPKVDLGPLQAAATALDGRVGGIEGQLAASKDGARATEVRAVGSADEARATPIALVGQSIGRAIASGLPYASDLDALKALGAEPDAVAKLAPLAADGAPTVAALKDQWDAVEGDVLAAVKPAEAGSALDRFAASARALVQVRRVGAVAGDDPAAVVSQVDAALGAGDVPAALAAWAKLPQAGQDKSQDWAAAARAEADAASAAQGLVGRAIATLGRTRS